MKKAGGLTPKKALIKLIQDTARRTGVWEVFSDFVELAALAISNSMDLAQFTPREARYLEIVKRYEPEQVTAFCLMLGHLTEALELEPADILGQVFMELELGNKWVGQFFTPQCLCDVMAGLTFNDVEELLAREEFITVSEPACGGGAMVIGVANHLRALKINYQERMHVTAVDVDLKAVHMAYVQLSLLHVPAVVVHGNTLTLQEFSHWRTPAHLMGFWDVKLRRRAREAVALGAPALAIDQVELEFGVPA